MVINGQLTWVWGWKEPNGTVGYWPIDTPDRPAPNSLLLVPAPAPVLTTTPAFYYPPPAASVLLIPVAPSLMVLPQ